MFENSLRLGVGTFSDAVVEGQRCQPQDLCMKPGGCARSVGLQTVYVCAKRSLKKLPGDTMVRVWRC